MPQKLTIKYVKQFVKDNTKGECEILDKEYVNNQYKMSIKCKCGNIFLRDFAHIRKGQFYCKDCKKNLFSEMYRADIKDVIQEIRSSGCEYISGDYQNSNSILTIRCRCGNIFKKSMQKFKSGQDRCPECGRKSLIKSKTKYDLDYVKKELLKSGYKVVGDYVDASYPIKCICSNGHEFELKFSHYLVGHSGCKQCANNMLKGKNNWNYQGGTTEVIDGIRKGLQSWKTEIKNAYGNVCAVTGEKPKRLVVHHLYSFLDIVKECCEELGVELKSRIQDYDSYEEYDNLKNAVIKKHNLQTGIPISQSLHLRFHNKYSREKNTPEQFDEFLKENYGISLNDVMKKVKE